MRIFIQLDDLYVANPNILEPLLLDLIAMGNSDQLNENKVQRTIYLVSSFASPSEVVGATWIHSNKVPQLMTNNPANVLIHFGPVANWAKNLPSVFIPLTFLVAVGVVYITFGNDLKIRVDNDKTVFYVYDSGFKVTGTELNKIFKIS